MELSGLWTHLQSSSVCHCDASDVSISFRQTSISLTALSPRNALVVVSQKTSRMLYLGGITRSRVIPRLCVITRLSSLLPLPITSCLSLLLLKILLMMSRCERQSLRFVESCNMPRSLLLLMLMSFLARSLQTVSDLSVATVTSLSRIRSIS